MWLRKIPEFYQTLASIENHLLFLWRRDNIFVMDNHLAAAWCWKQCCATGEQYNFLHIDRHRDFLCKDPVEMYYPLRDNEVLSIDDYCNLQGKYNAPLYRWDNYIKPTQLLFPKWFTHNVFVTQEGEVDPTTSTIVPQMYIQYINEVNELLEYLGIILSNSDDIGTLCANKWIVNLDLDFFFDNNCDRLYDDAFVKNIANQISTQMVNIQVLTICLSPDCCGDWESVINILDVFAANFAPLKNYVFPKSYQ